MFDDMRRMRDEGDDPRDLKQRRSLSPPSGDEGSDGGGMVLKKGPWTAAEDEILANYVNAHGEGNWNAIQKQTGLARCGKSCRLRWANHLRPDLKKGPFTEDEERLIIEMHASFGNKWARMALELPGRTDNEIKNYWNTRQKRLQRAGMPLYPEDVPRRFLAEDREGQNMGMMHPGGRNHPGFLPADNLRIIPDVAFKDLEYNNPGFSSYLSSLLPRQRVSISNNYNSLFQLSHPPRHPKQCEIPYPGLNSSGLSPFSEPCGKTNEPFPFSSLSSPYMDDLKVNNQSMSDVPLGSHAPFNGNPSSSEPIWVSKTELPSLQFIGTPIDTSWDPLMSPPLSPLKSENAPNYFPFTDQTQRDCPSPGSSGLLKAVVHGCQAQERSEVSSSRTHNVSTLEASTSSPDCTITQPEVQTFPNPFLSSRAASVSDGYSLINRSATHEPTSVGALLGHQIGLGSGGQSLANSYQNHISATRADVLLDQGFLGWSYQQYEEEENDLKEALRALIGKDFGQDQDQTSGVSNQTVTCSFSSICSLWRTSLRTGQWFTFYMLYTPYAFYLPFLSHRNICYPVLFHRFSQ